MEKKTMVKLSVPATCIQCSIPVGVNTNRGGFASGKTNRGGFASGETNRGGFAIKFM